MNRRQFLRESLAASGAGVAMHGQAGRAAKPNIVVIFADDMGWGDLACYGHPTIRTPHLDQMARDGMRFTQFYDAAPACSPSRAALLTGRLPVRSGMNQVLNPWSAGGLPASETTIAEALKPAGYATAIVGKWHLGHLPQYLPTRHGFDSYFGIPYSNDMSKATAGNPGFIKALEQHPEVSGTPLMRNEKTIEVEPDQSQITARYTDEATRFIRDSAKSRKPFFLYLPHTMPHHPLSASARFKGKSPRGLYGDVIEELDWSTGEVRRALRESGVERNTLVVFTSDNGPWLVKEEDGGSAGLLRDGKGTFWEGGFRVPGIAAWPGRIPAGITSLTPASTMDLLPTVLPLAGAKLPDVALDGRDLAPVLFRNQGLPAFTLFYYAGPRLRAVRHDDWKLILPANAGEKPQLYNLNVDPSEKYDRQAQHPDVAAKLDGIVAEHRRTLVPGAPQT